MNFWIGALCMPRHLRRSFSYGLRYLLRSMCTACVDVHAAPHPLPGQCCSKRGDRLRSVRLCAFVANTVARQAALGLAGVWAGAGVKSITSTT